MRLTRHNVISYLIAQGLLSPRAIVCDELTVIEASQRNTNFKVVQRAGPGYLVKQVADWAENSREALRRESRLHALAEQGALDCLKPHLPHCLHYDAHQHALTLSLIPHAASLGALLAQPAPLHLAAMAQLGHALGHLHRHTRAKPVRTALAKEFDSWLPWAMSSQAQTAAADEHKPAVAQLRRTLRTHPDISAHLAQLSREWRVVCLVHNDLKGDHCLVSGGEAPTPNPSPAKAGEGRPRSPLPRSDGGGRASDARGGGLCLIDWEMTTLGEPRWDVGCAIALALLPWVEMAAAQLVAPAAVLLRAAQQRLRAFWEAYAAAASLARAKWRAELRTCLRFAAARLVQTAYEDAHIRDDLSPREVLLLQLGQNIFRRPDEAVTQLLAF